MSDTILVTGASGKLGGAVIRHLLGSQGVEPSRIVAATRSPDGLASLAATTLATFAAQRSLGSRRLEAVATTEGTAE